MHDISDYLTSTNGWYWCWMDDTWHREVDIIRQALECLCTDDAKVPEEFCALPVLTGESPLHDALQEWCVNYAKYPWMTGLSVIEGAELIIEGAFENGNLKDLSDVVHKYMIGPSWYPKD